jgi:hypothetical protein
VADLTDANTFTSFYINVQPEILERDDFFKNHRH